MRVLVDYNTKHELGAASEEIERQFLKTTKTGKAFLQIFIGGCKHRVVIVNKPDPPISKRP